MISIVLGLVFVFHALEVLHDNCHVTYAETEDEQYSLALLVALCPFLNYHW